MQKNHEKEELRLLAQCLKDFLELDPQATNPYSILYFISNQTLINSDDDNHLRFSSFEIAHSVSNAKSEPSAWINSPWKKIHSHLHPKHEKSLSEYALKRGLDKYPWVAKSDSPGGAGLPVYYYLIGLPINKSDYLDINELHFNEPFVIKYISVQNLKPSWLAKLIFDNENSAEGFRKWLFVFYPLAEIIIYGLLILFFVLIFDQTRHPITTRDLVYVLFIYLAFLACKRNILRMNTFFDDRLIMASDHLLSLKENFIVQELVSVNDNEGKLLYKKVQLVKYVSSCSVCGAKVVLDKGEPNYPRRIIGKCYESPTEHVFSFDRVTKTGKRLL